MTCASCRVLPPAPQYLRRKPVTTGGNTKTSLRTLGACNPNHAADPRKLAPRAGCRKAAGLAFMREQASLQGPVSKYLT